MDDPIGSLALLALFLLVASALLLLWTRRQSSRIGLPKARVTYEDMSGWRRPPRPFFSARYGLTGRPDYVIQRGRHLVPVEVKPTRTAEEPYASDIMQLAAYCLLVEEAEGRPPYGLLRYRSETFRIRYTRALRASLIRELMAMQRALHARDIRPNHREPGRCVHCSYRHACGHRLA